jgi:hypothetical protein
MYYKWPEVGKRAKLSTVKKEYLFEIIYIEKRISL